MGEYSWPEELIVRIFQRLPIKPLIRFTCLSKRWRFIILSDPQFAKSHFLIASQNRTLTSKLLLISNPVEPDSEPESDSDSNPESNSESNPKPQFEFECESHDLGDNNAGDRKLQCPLNPLDRVTGISSCNGLVCVALWATICIWNPSTGSHTTLPLISSEMIFIKDIGFGYVSSSDDYKLIAHILVTKEDMDEDEDEDDDDDGDGNEEEEYHTFSLRTNMWKKIEMPPNSFPIGKSTLSNEAIHWLLMCRNYVSAFDLAMEDFRTIPLPRSIQQKLDSVFNLFSLASLCLGASLAGSLCLLDYHENKGFADLWVCREYGVMDSWSKQFTFKSSMMPHRFSLVTETSILLMTKYLTLIRIGHEEEEEEEEELEICSVNDSELGVIVYQETLLWLP